MSSSTATKPEILADVASITRTTEMPVITHYNIRRTLDIYGNVQGRDLGSVSRAINRVVAAEQKGRAPGTFVVIDGKTIELPRGNFVKVRG